MMADSGKDQGVEIGVELTPNPNSLKFVVNREILMSGSVIFKNHEEAKGSLLAEVLFEYKEIEGVMIGTNFITVSKRTESPWEPLVPKVFAAIKGALEMEGPWISEERLKKTAGSDDPISKKIQEILDNEIRPAVARDGGDIVFDSYENGVVKLFLQGACSSCPSSMMTLKFGIENRLKQMIPEVKEVIQI